MQANNDRYELPENTGSSIKKMYLWLGAFFGGLILIGLLVIIFAQSLVKLIPFKAEERLVEPIERLIVVDPDNVSEEHKFVQSYLENLVSGLEKSGEVSGKVKFKIHYSDKLVENAFATLGGHMVVYRGLMENVESENGLAMIIAHEMAHIENRDPAAGMGRAFAIQIMIASLSGGYSEGIVDLLSQAGFNQFSSKQEREADIFALDILNRHYGHVGGSREFFIKMKDKDKTQTNKTQDWLLSHPDIEKRLAYLEKESTDKGYIVGDTTPISQEVRKALKKTLF